MTNYKLYLSLKDKLHHDVFHSNIQDNIYIYHTVILFYADGKQQNHWLESRNSISHICNGQAQIL